jgi:short chain dehydrogenase
MPAPRPQCVVRGSATAASTSWLTMSAARSGRSPMRSTLRLRSRRRSAARFSQRSGAAVLRFRQCWDHGAGVIINVSSIATRSVNRVPYAAAKGGVTTITASLAIEYAAHGIRVCGVAPGGTEAPPRRIPAQRRRAERPGERMDPSGRGPDGLVEPDETLWHDRGAGGGDPVPGFRRGFVHHRRDFARGGRRPRLSSICRLAVLHQCIRPLIGACCAPGHREELHHRSDRIVDERLFWHGQRDRIFSAPSEGTRHPARGVRAVTAALCGCLSGYRCNRIPAF